MLVQKIVFIGAVDPDPQGFKILCHPDPDLEISDTDLDPEPELEKT
jgi:hypothetical protein